VSKLFYHYLELRNGNSRARDQHTSYRIDNKKELRAIYLAQSTSYLFTYIDDVKLKLKDGFTP
jgi:hypothetical protein